MEESTLYLPVEEVSSPTQRQIFVLVCFHTVTIMWLKAVTTEMVSSATQVVKSQS